MSDIDPYYCARWIFTSGDDMEGQQCTNPPLDGSPLCDEHSANYTMAE